MGKIPGSQRKMVRGDEASAAARALIQHLRLAVDELERMLVGGAEPRAPLVEREVMKPGEYADRLRVSVRKVHAWIKKGMPHFQIEGRVRIRVLEADAWLEQHADSHDEAQPTDHPAEP